MHKKTQAQKIETLRFSLEEYEKQVPQIQKMIKDFEVQISSLENEVAREHRRTGIEDAQHFAYSTVAQAATRRIANLRSSVEGLKAQLEAASARCEEVRAQLEHETQKTFRFEPNPNSTTSSYKEKAGATA